MPSPTDKPWPAPTGTITRRTSLALMTSSMVAGLHEKALAAPNGTFTIASHVSLPPTWFDPGEMPSLQATYMVVYPLHDALMKPTPDGNPGYALAESHSVSPDGLTYEFVLRKGIMFHNGDPVTSDDVKFTWDRYHGGSQKLLRDSVAAVETPDERRVVFRLKEPWPDFLTFYILSSGANWIVPRKYIEKVGDAGFKKAPIGAGPYKLVSMDPGVGLVMEAYEAYWRKVPSVKRIVMKVIPDEATRLVALKRGEVDFAYSIRGELAAEVKRTPGLKLELAPDAATYWMSFPEQWDPQSPWSNLKVRQAAALAVDYDTINKALNLGYSRVTSNIVPQHLKFFLATPRPVYDPAKARALLAEAGHPNGFDAGFYSCDSTYTNLAEAAMNGLAAIGIRAQLRPLERAAFEQGFASGKFRKGIVQGANAAWGNASTRIATWAVSGSPYLNGGYPDIDALFHQQLRELDEAKREATLHKIQQLIYDKTMFVNLWQLGFLSVSGPRVKHSTYGTIPGFIFIGPYEDITLNENA